MSAARKYLASKIGPRKLQPTLYFTMNCLLLTKAEGTPQNGDPLPQEDVDAYLTALRDQFEAQVPLPSERTRLLSRYDVGAWRRLANSSHGSLKYLILRTPNDFLLISRGEIFLNEGHRPISTARAIRKAPEVKLLLIGRPFRLDLQNLSRALLRVKLGNLSGLRVDQANSESSGARQRMAIWRPVKCDGATQAIGP